MSTDLLDRQDEAADTASQTLTPFSFSLAGSVMDGRGSGVIAASIRTGSLDEEDPEGSCDDSGGEFTREIALSLS